MYDIPKKQIAQWGLENVTTSTASQLWQINEEQHNSNRNSHFNEASATWVIDPT